MKHPTTVTVITAAGEFTSDPEPESEIEATARDLLDTLGDPDGFISFPQDGATLAIPSRQVIALRFNWAPGRMERAREAAQ